MQSTVLFVGDLPPPLGGKSNINQQIHSLLQTRCRLITINLSPQRLERSLLYHFHKIIRVIKGIGVVLIHAGTGHRLYLSADGGLGLLYNLLVITFARLTRYSIFLHYHSFSFINRRYRLMALLVAFSGRQATHIFLCHDMRDRFRAQYHFEGPSLVCSNARFVPPKRPSLRQYDGDRPLRLGLLSHLNGAKGLYDFLSLLRNAKEQKLRVCGILAGPPVSTADEEAISEAQSELGDYFDFRGPLYGEAKDAFYEEIDVFLFPTRFRVEAQPVVLFEALAHGVPIISYARGCIASDIEEDGGYVIPTNADFVLNALPRIKIWLEKPATLGASRAAASQLSRKHYDRAEGGFIEFLSVLTEPASAPKSVQARS
jgi:glycosyltransferase involved in cell wall biosynthesis